MPECRERLVFGRRGTLDLADVFAGDARRDLTKSQFAVTAPDQKAADNSTVRTPGVLVADTGPEEFVGGKCGVRGPLQDGDGHARNGQDRILCACRNQFSRCCPARHFGRR